MVLENLGVSATAMRREVQQGRRNLDSFRGDLQRFVAQQEHVAAIPAAADVSIFKVNHEVGLTTYRCFQ